MKEKVVGEGSVILAPVTMTQTLMMNLISKVSSTVGWGWSASGVAEVGLD